MRARVLAVLLAAGAVGGLSALVKPEVRGGLTRDEAAARVHEVFGGTDVACRAGDGGWSCAFDYSDADDTAVRGRFLIDDSPYPETGNLH